MTKNIVIVILAVALLVTLGVAAVSRNEPVQPIERQTFEQRWSELTLDDRASLCYAAQERGYDRAGAIIGRESQFMTEQGAAVLLKEYCD